MDVLSVRAWRGKQNNGLLRLLLPGAVIGIFIGYLLFDYLNEQILSVLLGLLSIGVGVWGLLKRQRLKVEAKSWLAVFVAWSQALPASSRMLVDHHLISICYL